MKLKIIKIQKKGLDFNEEGNYACLYHETKEKKIDWIKREKEYWNY